MGKSFGYGPHSLLMRVIDVLEELALPSFVLLAFILACSAVVVFVRMVYCNWPCP